MIEYKGITIKWFGHDSFAIKKDNVLIYIDPYALSQQNLEKADFIISTHEHSDHFSPADITKLTDPKKTVIFAVTSVKTKLSAIRAKDYKLVKPGDSTQYAAVKFEFVPAYNISKFRSPGKPFHPKESAFVGVIIDFGNNLRFYHAGDTDHIPEMKQIKTTVALLPVSGTYVMTAAEACEAVASLRAGGLKLAIPMHYGSIVGDEAMALEFQKNARCEVQVLTKE